MTTGHMAWVAGIALGLMAGGDALAQMPRDLHAERVLHQLTQPVKRTSAKDWLSLGNRADTNVILIAKVYDTDIHEIHRARAVQALAFFPTRRTRQFLWQVVYDRVLEDPFKRWALGSIGGAFQSDVVPELARFLRKEEKTLRLGAIEGLGLIRAARARSLLEGHLSAEQDLDLRLACEKAIAQVRRWEEKQERTRLESLQDVQPQQKNGAMP